MLISIPKMKGFYSIFLFLVLLTSNSVFGQVASVTQGCLPLTVDFTAPPGYATHYWDFDDGATSTTQNPTNIYLNAGAYVVEFKETATGPVVGTITINVYDKPVPTYTSSATEGCIPLTVSFAGTTVVNPGVVINNTSWIFSNGYNISGPAPNVIFTTSGSFNLSLGITTNFPSCNTSQQYNNVVTVASNPVVSFGTNPNPAFACQGPLNVGFQNNSTSQWGPLTYVWDFDNGSTSNAVTPPDQSYTDGNYTVTLTATDTIGCSNSITKQVSVGGPTASFIVPDTVCLFSHTTLVNTSPPGSYTWTFDAGTYLQPGSFVFSVNPAVKFHTGGYHSITLSLGGPCPDDTTITFYVEDVDPSFTTSPDFACSDPLTSQFIPNDLTGASYDWYFPGSPIFPVTDMMPFHSYEVADTHTYTINGGVPFETWLIFTSQAGCKDTGEYISIIHKPNALIYPSITDGCVPLTVSFTDASTSLSDIANWEWHFGDGTIYTDTMSVDTSFTYTAVGDYYPFLIITNDSGCVDTSYMVPIHVGDVIDPNFSISNITLCPGDSVSFADITVGPYADSIDTWHYYSDNSTLFSCFQEPNPTWAYTDSIGSHDVTFEVGYNGCYSDTTVTNAITVNGPIAGINYSIDCDVPMTANFEDASQGATTIIWHFGDGTTSTTANPNHTYAATGDYNVLQIASNPGTGCANDTARILVHIRNLQASFTVDSVLCVDVLFQLDASTSVDVFNKCARGFNYYFDGIDRRPFMTDSNNRFVEVDETGFLEIMLVVSDINNCTDTARRYANVYGVTADFSLSDTTVCFPLNLTATDLSFSDTTLVSWQWIFPSGQSSTLQNPNVVLDGTIINDNDSTLLIVTDAAGCTAYDSLTFVIYEPVTTATVSNTTICTGMDIDFTATDFTDYTNLTFAWDFGDGNSSNAQNPTIDYDSVGVYNVVLTYAEVGSGCGGVEAFQITVGEFPTASFTSTADTVAYLCPGENVLFTNTSVINPGSTFYWDFGNGLNSNVQDAGTVYTTNGTYNVQFILTSALPFGCKDTVNQTILVQSPQGDFITDIGNDTICRLDVVEFTIVNPATVGQFYWDFGDGTGAGQVSPVSNQYTFVPPSGQTIAKLVMANPDGSCPVTQSHPINIYEVIADFNRNGNDIDTAICQQPYPLTNTSSNASSFYWDFGNGQTSTSGNPPPHIYEPGTYDVSLGILYGAAQCTDTVTKTVIIFENPKAEIEGDTICEGEFVLLETAFQDSIYSYLWTSNPVFSVNNLTTPVVSDNPTSLTQYFLTVTDTNGCIAMDEAYVDVYNVINIPDFDTIIVLGDSTFLPMPYDSDNFTFYWEPDTGLSCNDCPNPTINPLSSVTYTLFITDNYGCFTDEAVYKVLINPTTHIKLPTTFTPNGDGKNDIIYVEGWGIKELIEFRIFNRWGELVFETSDKEVGWDGYYKGVLQNNDVYLVQVRGLTYKDEEKTIEQYINLVR
ncbi:MAG: PKD domain-containing protein [Crocinitomicaceae bacterium]